MSPTKRENLQGNDESFVDRRAAKLWRKRHPRDRRLAQRKKPQIEAEAAQEARMDSGKQKIAKHITRFPEINTPEGETQAAAYINWVAQSLSQGEPRLDDEDIDFKFATASVKAGGEQRQKSRTSVRATHLPTQIAVKNEETRSVDQNKLAAYENLRLRLTDHLSLWQTLSQNLPQQYSALQIKQHGVDLLKELS